ncbi:ras-related protein Rab-34-like protein [Dinothrombium tinctorium]|uniref:Ras-related protein Rab-36 n=1 Tax=Dinothrombium tinctorium TaxID=1965070 RepID=A0A443R135_9ACAR|nr:ras-related protein Rab-34-like protein [Dinothrombium tinctorium]RWS15573.1 ras-related protein Rab-34-like protein [Dinothrombium tinctorium]
MEYRLERAVASFPLPYNSDGTIYREYRFSREVRDFCEQEALDPKAQLRVAKCVVVGDIGVGKTCLINRFGYNIFSNNYKATIGVDFDVQRFKILQLPFCLQIWDTAGQERFKCITSTYYRGAHVAVVVFDMSNVNSLSSAKKWVDEMLTSNAKIKPIVFLVGSKKDLVSPSVQEFIENEAIKVAQQLEAEYWSVSAQTGENIEDLFTRIAVLTFQEVIWREIEAAENEKRAADEKNKSVINYSDNFVRRKKSSCFGKSKCFSFKCFKCFKTSKK